MNREPFPTDWHLSNYIRAVRALGKSGRRINMPYWAWDALVAAGWD